MIGVYKIVNLLTGGVYIGKTVHLEYRYNEHLLSLRANRHENPLLQNTFNKHGEGAFSYEVIEEVATDAEANSREIYWIKWYRDNQFEVYNVTDGGTGGDTWSGMSPERRAELKLKGRKPLSSEVRSRAGASNRRRWQDPEYRKKMSALRKGRKQTSQAIKNRAESLRYFAKLRKLIALAFAANDEFKLRRLQLLYILKKLQNKRIYRRIHLDGYEFRKREGNI